MTDQMSLPLGEPTRFYLYDQNNSGGYFVYDENFGRNVLIEAHSPNEANEKMADMGCWSHGCCSCCGDRWHSFYSGDTYDVYQTVEEVMARCAPDPAGPSWNRKGEDLVVHYLDGRREWFNKEAQEK
jgi:hypothetical protein